ncbi:MAG: hypothetical protein AB1781_09010 [Pseudomonadota bacterium]
MKRGLTFLWLPIAASVCFGLFLAKYEVQTLEAELASLNRIILARQEEIHVLQAEWAYLSRPERIQSLSERLLDLRPVAVEHIGTAQELPPSFVRLGESARLGGSE